MEKLTREVCEGKLAYWNQKLAEVEAKEQKKEDTYEQLWRDLAEAVLTSATAAKKKLTEQMERGV